MTTIPLPANTLRPPQRLWHLIGSLCLAVFTAAPAHAQSSALDKQDADGLTALMKAAAKGEVAKVKDLIAKGANPNVKSSDSAVTALHLAAYWGQTEVVNALIAAKADAMAKATQDMGPIDYAASGGQLEAAKALKAAGASLKPSAGGFGAFLDAGTLPFALLSKASGKPIPK